MSIVITSGKSAKALKAISNFNDCEFILVDYGEMPDFPSKKYRFFSLGELNKETVAHTLLRACLDLGATAIIPLLDFEIEALRQSVVLFEEFDIQVMLNGEVPNIL